MTAQIFPAPHPDAGPLWSTHIRARTRICEASFYAASRSGQGFGFEASS